MGTSVGAATITVSISSRRSTVTATNYAAQSATTVPCSSCVTIDPPATASGSDSGSDSGGSNTLMFIVAGLAVVVVALAITLGIVWYKKRSSVPLTETTETKEELQGD